MAPATGRSNKVPRGAGETCPEQARLRLRLAGWVLSRIFPQMSRRVGTALSSLSHRWTSNVPGPPIHVPHGSINLLTGAGTHATTARDQVFAAPLPLLPNVP